VHTFWQTEAAVFLHRQPLVIPSVDAPKQHPAGQKITVPASFVLVLSYSFIPCHKKEKTEDKNASSNISISNIKIMREKYALSVIK
jgi:hypothetical protein